MKSQKSGCCNYFLCGFSGAGKSTLLEEISQTVSGHLDFEFIDLDSYIFEKYAHGFSSLGEFINSKKMETFRSLELVSIKELTRGKFGARRFVALGGGTLSEEVLELFAAEAWKGFWLDIPFETCFERISGDINRPLAALGRDKLRVLYAERQINYSKFKRVSSAHDVIASLA